MYILPGFSQTARGTIKHKIRYSTFPLGKLAVGGQAIFLIKRHRSP
jgi:hypothetical protein